MIDGPLPAAAQAVKAWLELRELAPGVNDLLIHQIDDLDDAWIFYWNNVWAFVGQRIDEYPGCDPVLVFKDDPTTVHQLPRSYGWVEGSLERAIDEVRAARATDDA